MRPPSPFADPVAPTRVRTLPRHFAWLDHRLRERLRELSLEEIALLVFLHLAADPHGLREGDIRHARAQLVGQGLIAYRSPLYQLLPLDGPADAARA